LVLLRKDGTGYIAGDIKSGAREEGGSDDSDSKPKKHYAVQLALYTDILKRLDRSTSRRGFIWDIHGDEVIYDCGLSHLALGIRVWSRSRGTDRLCR
jgi:hypothetical protein